MTTDNSSRHLAIYYLLFGISGFAGLIYESIWTHYIRLFLGHAAYAQSLVLAIFMGGMAIGAWIASRTSAGWTNLLLAYATVEGIIGLTALLFHRMFTTVADVAHDVLIPGLGSAEAAYALKWTLSAALILPQSILLGMTFPLMTGGIMRLFPATPGTVIAMLYFTNSLGAALGVLTSAFYLIGKVGLPGAILTAGLLNVSVAIVVWMMARDRPVPAGGTASLGNSRRSISRIYVAALAVALLTGAASFLYEIAWIRMLSLVLGSSTNSFELMLSAFIFGLAFGGLFIRRHIEALHDPLPFLGWVQVAMGLLAASTFVLYGASFDWMKYALRAIARTDEGFVLFNVASHLICFTIMLPATFCAGMTLPLLTFLLLKRGHGEPAIGAVYAANTVGAIVGVVLAVHWLMPTTGVKGTLLIGAGLDLLLGVGLLMFGSVGLTGLVSCGIAALLVLAIGVFVPLDLRKTASGVYRHGRAMLSQDTEVTFHRDGKTATVALIRDKGGSQTITTNGKPDARIMPSDQNASMDENTMVFTGAIGLLLHPRARTAANIGIGSGLSSHVLLSTPQLDRLDTIEIEPFMVEAARGFRERVKNTFHDRRSRIVIEDAKTFFSTYRAQYDLIVSEPSNPWVSGVSSLFSIEFYGHVKRHLRPNGLLVQWIQAYEIDMTLIASIIGALSAHFEDYVIFNSNEVDLIIVASPTGTVPELRADAFDEPGLRAELKRVNIFGQQDVEVRRLANKATLGPLFASFGAPQNSDFFPFLDQNAARKLFMKATARELNSLRQGELPMLEMLERRHLRAGTDAVAFDPNLQRASLAAAASALKDAWLRKIGVEKLQGSSRQGQEMIILMLNRCDSTLDWEAWLEGVLRLSGQLAPYIEPEAFKAVMSKVENHQCLAKLPPKFAEWMRLVQAIGARDPDAMTRRAELLLGSEDFVLRPHRRGFLADVAMLGHVVAGRKEHAWKIWEAHGQIAYGGRPLPVDTRLLIALSEPKRPGGNVAMH